MANPPINHNPKISVNDLALFMVSSETGRLGIIRRAKYPQKPVIIRYRDARVPICSFLADINRNITPLNNAIAMFEQRITDTSVSALMQDDARNSIVVLQDIQLMSNSLGAYNFSIAPNTQRYLNLEGVNISIKTDLFVHGAVRNGHEQIGAAILRMTQSNETTPLALSRRKEMGLYVAALIKLHSETNLANQQQEVKNNLCMSIDIQHRELFIAPKTITRRTSDIRSACRFIAAIWNTI